LKHRPAQPVERDDDEGVAGPQTVEAFEEAWPIGSDPGQFVGEDALDTGAADPRPRPAGAGSGFDRT